MLSLFILVTDLSTASLATVNRVSEWPPFGARECLLLQCLSVQEATSTALSYSTASIDTYLTEQKIKLEQKGYSVTTRIVPGFASAEINRIAQEEGYPLVVVGACRQHVWAGENLLGGIAQEIIHHVIHPVLILRVTTQQDAAAPGTPPFSGDISEHILFPTDFSENADHAFQYLETRAMDGVQRVTLLHVQDQSRIDPQRLGEFNTIDQARLDKLQALLESKGSARITSEIAYGDPETEILRVIHEQQVRLVLMGSQGRGFVQELFLGSVSHAIARHAPSAVLLVPMRR